MPNSAENLKNAHRLAYEKACAQLALKNNPEEIAGNCSVDFDKNGNVFIVKYLNETYSVGYPDGKVNFLGREDEVPIAVKIVILHYLLTATGMPLSGQIISFKEVPGGMIYLEPFQGRVLGGLVAIFGKNAGLLETCAEKIGGRKEKFGDIAVTLDILPSLPVTYVLWEGDEEIEPKGTVLFDSSAASYLPTEDLVVAAAAGASLLNKTAKTLK